MKIICNKKEFAELVRGCYENSTNNESCECCLFLEACSRGYTTGTGDIITGIEDICVIVDEEER